MYFFWRYRMYVLLQINQSQINPYGLSLFFSDVNSNQKYNNFSQNDSSKSYPKSLSLIANLPHSLSPSSNRCQIKIDKSSSELTSLKCALTTSQQKCEQIFFTSRKQFRMSFCMRNLNADGQYCHIRIINTDTAETYDAKIDLEALFKSKMTEFISPFEFFEEFRNNFDKILMEENGSIKYNLKIGHFQRMKTIVTTKYPASIESVMETKKILEQRVNELIEMLPESIKNKKIENEKRQNVEIKPIFGATYMRTGMTKLIANNGFSLTLGKMDHYYNGQFRGQTDHIYLSKVNESESNWHWYELINGNYVFRNQKEGLMLGVNPQTRGFHITIGIDTWEQWYKIPVGDKFLMKTIFNQYLFIIRYSLVIHQSAVPNENFLWSDKE